MDTALQLDTFGITDIGRVLKANTDHFLIADVGPALRVRQSSLPPAGLPTQVGPADGQLLVVADGQSTDVIKDQASQLAVASITAFVAHLMPWLAKLDGQSEHELADEWRAALVQCQQQIAADCDHDAEVSQATVTLAYLQGRQAVLVHVGSGRGYRWRGSTLHRLTTDHTVAQQLQDAGLLGREEIAPFQQQPATQQVWNTLGGDTASPEPEVHRLQLEMGEGLLLMSDGLGRHVDDAEISQILHTAANIEEAAQWLIQAANDNGGTDNATVVIARLIGGASSTSGKNATGHSSQSASKP